MGVHRRVDDRRRKRSACDMAEIAVVLAVASGLVMLALLVYRAWERLGR
jgi:hypothetical protein